MWSAPTASSESRSLRLVSSRLCKLWRPLVALRATDLARLCRWLPLQHPFRVDSFSLVAKKARPQGLTCPSCIRRDGSNRHRREDPERADPSRAALCFAGHSWSGRTRFADSVIMMLAATTVLTTLHGFMEGRETIASLPRIESSRVR